MSSKELRMQQAIFRALLGQTTPEDEACLVEFEKRYEAGEFPSGTTDPMPPGLKGSEKGEG
jgi:hypothetical protein